MSAFRRSIRIFYSVIYTLLGVAGFIAFICLQNYVSSCLAFITAVTNGVLSHIHILAFRRNLRAWYENYQLKDISRFAFVVLCVGAMGLGYFGASEIMLKRPILPVSKSVVIPIIWSLITMKSAGTVLYYSYFYREENYDEDQATLVNSLVEAGEEEEAHEVGNQEDHCNQQNQSYQQDQSNQQNQSYQQDQSNQQNQNKQQNESNQQDQSNQQNQSNQQDQSNQEVGIGLDLP